MRIITAILILAVLAVTNSVFAAPVLPRVIGVFPQRNSTSVGVDRLIGASFNMGMDPTTLTEKSFSVIDEFGDTVRGKVIYDKGEKRVFFKASDPLRHNTLYTAIIASYLIKDELGRSLVADESWSFRTIPEGGMGILNTLDKEQPKILEITPPRGATAFPEDGDIGIKFSKLIKPSSINSFTMWLESESERIPVKMLYSDTEHSIRLIPIVPLLRGKKYKVTVTDGIEDLNGNFLANPMIWFFFTRPEPDTVLPEIVDTSPIKGATEVRRNAEIMVSFSEPMARETLVATNITLSSNEGPVSGLISVNKEGNKLAFTPEDTLDYGVHYTLRINRGVTDLAGNNMKASVEIPFTVETAPDITGPTVTMTWPRDGQDEVPLDARIRVRFDEAIKDVTINAFSLYLKDGARVLPATITYDQKLFQATLVPNNGLEWDTEYTLGLTPAIKDLTGNSMEPFNPVRFRSVEPPDLKGPEVLSSVPENHATGLRIRPRIEINFDEPVDTDTLTETNLILCDEAGDKISGTFNATEKNLSKLIFIPNRDLDYSRTYSFTLAGDITDLKGNKMGLPTRIYFTTMEKPDTIPPRVLYTSPLNGATGVSLGASISVNFSEEIEPVTVNEFTISMHSEGDPVKVGLHYDRLTRKLLIEPNYILTYGATYVVTLKSGIRDMAGNSMTADHIFRFTMADEPDRESPRIVLVNPQDEAIGVPVNSKITIRFSEAIHDLTLNEYTLMLHQASLSVPCIINYDRLTFTATLTPSKPLLWDKVYTLSLSNEIRDLAGNPMIEGSLVTFTTEKAPDTERPVITKTLPENGEKGLPVDIRPEILFSEPINPDTVNSFTISLRDDKSSLDTKVVLDKDRVVILPVGTLAFDTQYKIVASRMISDLAGNNMLATRIITFMTQLAPDTIPPQITSVIPKDGTKKVSIGDGITVEFSETVDDNTVNDGTFVLQKESERIIGSLLYMPEKPGLHFQPAQPLEYDSDYRILISDGIKDLAGNPLQEAMIIKFRTEKKPDTVRPVVVDSWPGEGAIKISNEATVWAIFSKDMDISTINEQTFLLYHGREGVPATVNYDEEARKAVLTPMKPLEYESAYRVMITNRAYCTSGNPLAMTTAWEFSTVEPPDTIPPRLVTITPGDGAIMVAEDQFIRALFSEPISPGTLNQYTFMVLTDNGEVEGTIRWDAIENTAIFAPTSQLIKGKRYRVSLTAGIQDLAKNGLENPMTTVFFVGREVDNTPPTVIMTIPEEGGLGISSAERIAVTFSERIDPSTLNPFTFIVNDGTKNIDGKVEYRDFSRQGIFTPASRLELGKTYRATVTAGIKDISGNNMANATSWAFRTRDPQ